MLPPPLGPTVAAELGANITYIETINELGGRNGVDVTGVAGTLGVVVTPRLKGIFGDLIEAARVAVSGRTVMDFIVRASASVPELAAALQIPVVAQVFAQVAAGTPLGWALAGAAGLAVDLFRPEPDINDHGAVHADRTQAGEWETFTLSTLDDDQVSLLSWQGLFSAQLGGGAGVYANRPQVGEWEWWGLLRHSDDTVSLRMFNGHYLCAEAGGGRECQADRTSVGDWERFHLDFVGHGRVTLRTVVTGHYVSVQP